MLTESPWAQSSTVTYQLTGARAEIFLTTRWASALPIRRAMALAQFGEAGLQDERAVDLLSRSEPEYVIEVAGFPTTLIHQGAEKFEAELLKSTRLYTPTSRPVPPSSVTVPPHGMHLMATLRFPRFEGLDTKDGWIELAMAQPGAFKFQERFKLKDMVYEGRLEL